MINSRRHFIKTLGSGALLPAQLLPYTQAANARPWHEQIAHKARKLASNQPLRILIPHGAGANVIAATAEFTRLSGVQCNIEEVAVDVINVELILRSGDGDNSIDVALPATFGLTDLVQAKAILPLDTFAKRHEPADFTEGYLYRKGDRVLNEVYGYQTDGDSYMLFYNKRMMQDPAEKAAYLSATGKPLQVATSWEELDSMMAFFQRPEKNVFGGCLFRNPGYLVWEWWARFHAKGLLPFSPDMRANVHLPGGVQALEELIAASHSLSPGSISNGLFDNWIDFAQDNVFCNIGWGGTQKYLNSQPLMRDNLLHSALPGINDKSDPFGYFNWGWNYTVCSNSKQPELAYLLALFCVTPTISTIAVRDADGFFDPFRVDHYDDDTIREVYGDSFLDAHRQSLTNSIPDLYISGQSNYMDVLRQQILAAVNGELSAQKSLAICSQKWTHITRRLGKARQIKQWQNLLQLYPESFMANLTTQ